MNTASEDLTYHFSVLKEKLLHPTDYELSLTYFLEEFAGDRDFHLQGEKEEAGHLRVLLELVAEKMLNRKVFLKDFRAFYLPGRGFFHGRAMVGKGYLMFFYFECINRGIATHTFLGQKEQMVARWQLPEHMPRNPKFN